LLVRTSFDKPEWELGSCGLTRREVVTGQTRWWNSGRGNKTLKLQHTQKEAKKKPPTKTKKEFGE